MSFRAARQVSPDVGLSCQDHIIISLKEGQSTQEYVVVERSPGRHQRFKVIRSVLIHGAEGEQFLTEDSYPQSGADLLSFKDWTGPMERVFRSGPIRVHVEPEEDVSGVGLDGYSKAGHGQEGGDPVPKTRDVRGEVKRVVVRRVVSSGKVAEHLEALGLPEVDCVDLGLDERQRAAGDGVLVVVDPSAVGDTHP
uniref:SEP domain-containing protein n=1 Tax=Steinernema glaseri TaxID=37863 RepID=A0A1I7Y246_9BILA